MTELVLKPGNATLADWRTIYRGATPALDPACKAAIEASAKAVERIVAKGEPVYGINTGFGKLASVRIPAADLETLQRNIVLSHAAGVGEPRRCQDVQTWMVAPQCRCAFPDPRPGGLGFLHVLLYPADRAL